MALFGSVRDAIMQIGVASEFVGNVVTQQIGYYKVILPESPPNVYGEGLVKDYIGPILINCLIVRGDFSTVTDDSSYYTFLSGRTTIADGAYSNYYFLTGSIDITYTNTTPQTAINNELYYTYNSGTAIQRSFILKDDFNQPHTFYCDGELSVGKVLYTNIELTNPAPLIEGWKVDINLDNILDAIWTSTSNTGVIEETRFGNSITLSGTPYFYISPYQYLNNLINLYTDSSMSIPASGLDIVADFNNDSFDDHLTTDEFGAINLTISTVLSGVRYYYSADSDMLDNFIQLFTNAELTIPAADLDIAGDFNNDSVEDQLTTDSNGYVTVIYG